MPRRKWKGNTNEEHLPTLHASRTLEQKQQQKRKQKLAQTLYLLRQHHHHRHQEQHLASQDPLERQLGVFVGRNGESFDWKGGADERTLFHFNRSKRRGSTTNGWSVVCNVHAPEVPEGSATGDARCCSRSFTADSACVALRVLKKWCLDGTVVGTKSEHCNVAHFPRDVPDDLPSHDHLDAQWQLLRPTL